MSAQRSPTVRFAPSPTGFFHIGSARTALFNYLYARKNHGTHIVRFEDTDIDRSTAEFEQNIREGLAWLGIEYDEEYRQSERLELYREHIEHLLKTDAVYISQETEGDRSEVIRFRNPGGSITFVDQIRGEVTFDVAELGDFVIAKSVMEPLYHLAVVIDDIDMGITHVIRGEDHISNTPRQILILEALGGERPTYAHIPMILAPDRSKMSKRHGAVSISEYRSQGFLPEALINYLALLGWNPGTDEEVMDTRTIIEKFELGRIQKSGAVFSIEKLRWFNAEHMKFKPLKTKIDELDDFLNSQAEPSHSSRVGEVVDLLKKSPVFAQLVFERIDVYGDVLMFIEEGEYDYIFERPSLDASKLSWKETPQETTVAHLRRVSDALADIDEESFTSETTKDALWDYASEQGRGEVLWPLRYALSGRERSADPFTLCSLLGKEETLARVQTALES